MIYRYEIKEIRLNSNVSFFEYSSEELELLKQVRGDSQKVYQKVFSDDGNTRTCVYEWKDKNDFEKFRNDSRIRSLFLSRDFYNDANNITKTITILD